VTKARYKGLLNSELQSTPTNEENSGPPASTCGEPRQFSWRMDGNSGQKLFEFLLPEGCSITGGLLELANCLDEGVTVNLTLHLGSRARWWGGGGGTVTKTEQ
jgi:hypothetical protein